MSSWTWEKRCWNRTGTSDRWWRAEGFLCATGLLRSRRLRCARIEAGGVGCRAADKQIGALSVNACTCRGFVLAGIAFNTMRAGWHRVYTRVVGFKNRVGLAPVRCGVMFVAQQPSDPYNSSAQALDSFQQIRGGTTTPPAENTKTKGDRPKTPPNEKMLAPDKRNSASHERSSWPRERSRERSPRSCEAPRAARRIARRSAKRSR